jgi:serine/threonine protein kinase
MNDLVVAQRYRLGRRIGAGGMGRVWLAVDEVLRRDVAVKEILLPDGLTEDEAAELRMRTLREARTAAALSHPNVIKIYDVIYAEQRPWIVMEYVESRSLSQVIKDDGPLPPETAARIGLSVLDALVAAHDAGVLHRDVKPGNVLLGADGRVVLTDFGLATFDDVGSALTASGVVHGSPQFIAPERALDGTSTAAADMWSLGATLYAAVEGRAPYARASSYATLTALATAPPDPPRHAGALKPVLGGLLRRNPASRMRPDEVRAWLQRIASGDGPGSYVIPRQIRRDGPGDTSPSGSGRNGRGGATSGPSPAGASGSAAPNSAASGPAQGRERRNRRPFGDSGGLHGRPADLRADRPFIPGSPPPTRPLVHAADADLGMPIAGARPQALPPRPVVDDEHDTDRQMDLAWQLDTAAGIPGAVDAPGSRSILRERQRRRARRRRTRWLAAVLGVAIVAGACAYAIEGVRHRPQASGTGPGAAAVTNDGVSAGTLWPCAQRSATARAGLPLVAAAGPSTSPVYNKMSVPNGFRWYSFSFPDGLTGAAPIGWLVAQNTAEACFYDPNASRILGVEEWRTTDADAIAVLKDQERAMRASGAFPRYRLIDFEQDPVTPGVADWEFTFDAPAAVGGGITRTHAIVHLILRPGRPAHAICWITPDVDWTTEFAFYDLFMPSYEIGDVS